ncbi:hypothetical protein N2152v2_002864 [Parachlorella kessleri]
MASMPHPDNTQAMLPTCNCPDSPFARRRQVVSEGRTRPVGTVYYKCARAGNERGNDGFFMWEEEWEIIQCAERERLRLKRLRQHDEPAVPPPTPDRRPAVLPKAAKWESSLATKAQGLGIYARAKAEPLPKEGPEVTATARKAGDRGLEAAITELVAAINSLALQVGVLAESVAVAHA